MKYTENALNILTIMESYKRIGKAWIIKNLNGNEDVDKIVELLNKNLSTSIEEFKRFKEKLKNELIFEYEKYEDCCDGIIALGDKNFPDIRGKVIDSEKPVVLFYKGDIDLLSIDNINISVIGLINPDSEIIKREQNIVDQFVRNKATIISGLAFGCDSIAHKQTLDSYGKTVAILPSPLNKILPVQNRNLAYEIYEQGGLLITEYYNDFKDRYQLIKRYIDRDRLQALFCDTIVLIASYDKNSADNVKLKGQKLDSGARFAINYAKKYDIPISVMYDQNIDKDNPMFDLNRNIIEEQKDIIILDEENYIEKIKEIVNKIRIKKDEKIKEIFNKTRIKKENGNDFSLYD